MTDKTNALAARCREMADKLEGDGTTLTDLLREAAEALAAPAGGGNVVADPHHNGACEWRWEGNRLFHRTPASAPWVECKRVSVTPKRIAAIYAALPAEGAQGEAWRVAAERILGKTSRLYQMVCQEAAIAKVGAEMEATRPAATAVVPEGWQLVPRDAPIGMLEALSLALYEDVRLMSKRERFRSAYAAMLSAAPAAPKGGVVDEAMVDRACAAYNAIAFEFASRNAMQAALIAALNPEQQP